MSWATVDLEALLLQQLHEKGLTVAQKVITMLVDDIDGGEGAETVSFALDGALYEIDLSEQNASSLRKALDEYVSNARKVSGRARRLPKASNGEVDNSAVRAWAASAKVPLSTRGRIPASIIEQYRAAGN